MALSCPHSLFSHRTSICSFEARPHPSLLLTALAQFRPRLQFLGDVKIVSLRDTEACRNGPIDMNSETRPRHRGASLGTPTRAADHAEPTEAPRHHRRRSSAFLEVGLGGQDAIIDAKIRRSSRPKMQVRFNSKVEVVEPDALQLPDESDQDLSPYQRPQIHYPSPPALFPNLPRILFLVCVLALLVPSWRNSPFLGAGITPIGAKAGSVKTPLPRQRREIAAKLVTRQNSPTDVCLRWSQQTALVNGTLYSYGGHTTTEPTQTENTWSKARSPSVWRARLTKNF